MKDGYYLSAYLVIDPMLRVRHFNWRHDQNFALWEKKKNSIQLIEYYEMERYTGFKHHRIGFTSCKEANNMINSILLSRGISLDDINEIWGTPALQQECDLFIDRHYSYHSLCHLFSTLLMNTKIFKTEKILGFAVDGGPDYYVNRDPDNLIFYCGCYSKYSDLKLFPAISPAVIWHTFSKLLNMEEGSLMALASATTANLNTPPDPIIQVYGGLDDEKLIGYLYKAQNRIYDILNNKAPEKICNYDNRFTLVENAISMTMKKVQEMSITIMRINIEKAISQFQITPAETYLAMSGGFTLNCPANTALIREFGFKGFLGTPCPNDAGQALGIGLYTFFKRMGMFEFHLDHAYYGQEDDRLDELLVDKAFAYYIDSVTELCYEKAVEDIVNSPIVWFNSRAEIGPRALGNRSILGDPRSIQTKEVLNRIKSRQWWRPVAPVILEEDLCKWFEDAWSSPYMLNTFSVYDEKRNKIPAAIHLDQTARVQTVSRKQNPVLYDLLQTFKKKTGVPILCNTSLNDKGEPIINKAAEALNFALRKGIKIVYINRKRIVLKNSDIYPNKKPLRRPYVFSFQTAKQDNEYSLNL